MGCGSKSLWVGWVGSTHGGSPALTVDSVRRLLPGCTLLGAASVMLVSTINTDKTNPRVAEPVLCHCLCLCVRQVMRMSIGTNPRTAEPVLCPCQCHCHCHCHCHCPCHCHCHADEHWDEPAGGRTRTRCSTRHLFHFPDLDIRQRGQCLLGPPFRKVLVRGGLGSEIKWIQKGPY